MHHRHIRLGAELKIRDVCFGRLEGYQDIPTRAQAQLNPLDIRYGFQVQGRPEFVQRFLRQVAFLDFHHGMTAGGLVARLALW